MLDHAGTGAWPAGPRRDRAGGHRRPRRARSRPPGRTDVGRGNSGIRSPVQGGCMKSVLPTVALAASLPICLAGCVVVDTQGHIAREEKRFTVTGLPELRLTTFDGAIEIRAGEGKSVVVEVEKRGPTPQA